MGDVVAGRDDRNVTLGAAGDRADEFVDIRDRDAVDVRVGIEHVDADKVVVRAILDRQPIDRDIGVACDGDNGKLVRPGGIGIHGVDDQ
jgi:hypothetical protein